MSIALGRAPLGALIRLPRARRLASVAALALLVPVLLAGCTSDDASSQEASPAATNESARVAFEDYDLGNVTIPKEDLENATLGEAHVHDLWGDFQSLVLFEGEVEAGLCEGPFDAFLYAFIRALAYQEAAYGCARIVLPEGAVVPEGTAELLVEVDAGNALKSGGMSLLWRNKAREGESSTSTSPTASWSVPLNASDWDIPHAAATSFVAYVVARGPVGVLEGTLTAKVTAVKIAGWQPVLAVAHVDHWKLPDLHDMPAPGVMRLVDTEVSVTNVDPARFTGGGAPLARVRFEDIVAPGATRLTLVVDRLSTDCLAVLECRVVPFLETGGYRRFALGEVLLDDGDRRVYAWKVPDEVPEDSVYANASTTEMLPLIQGCVKGFEEQTCGIASLASNRATARILALSWKDRVDLDLLVRIADGEVGAREA